jgi:drug/metabolite transporter (DMT)-like permease
MGGIAMLYYGKSGCTLSIDGTLWVLSSALSYAIYLAGVNRSGLKTMAPVKLTFYVLLFGTLLFLITTILKGNVTIPGELWMWGNLLALAIIPTIISLICTTLAVQHIGSTPTAIIGVFEPVTAIIFGITIFRETLSKLDIVGIIMIIIAVTLVIAGGHVVKPIIAVKRMFPKVHKSKKS